MGLRDFALQEFALLELASIVAAGLCSAALIVLLRPLFLRYALARPNARSSHTAPTPQGGGVAVVLAVMLTLGIAGGFIGPELAALPDALPLRPPPLLLTLLPPLHPPFPLHPLP